MNSTQTNTNDRDVVVTAAETLESGRLVKITNASGVANAALPTAIADLAVFVVVDGAGAGEPATIRALTPGKQARVTLKATCVPGDVLVNADPSTAADAGKVRKIPTAGGTYRGIAIAEEAGVDGQAVLCRPYPLGNITVT